MEIEFLKPPVISSLNKATVHRSGKLGFSQGAKELMRLTGKSFIKVGKNKEDSKDSSLYVLVVEEEAEDTIKISKAGSYYFANTKALFEEMNLDYKSKKVIYDIIETNYREGKIFRLLRREVDRKLK